MSMPDWWSERTRFALRSLATALTLAEKLAYSAQEQALNDEARPGSPERNAPEMTREKALESES